MDKIGGYFDQLVALVVKYGARLLLAILVLIVGLWVIKRLVRFVDNTMNKRNVDPSLRPFLKSIIGALLKIMLIISVMSMVGVEMTSFIAVLGAAGLAVGLGPAGQP